MYNDIISIQNLCKAWEEFVCGKKSKKDVAEFSLNFSYNIFKLHSDLKDRAYCHGDYQAFAINDPKSRDIHKATVRDRLLHHAIYRVLYPCFDKKFIYDSYSCRDNKGMHKALNRFRHFGYKVSHNNTRTCWILKCDIKKFFANIDHTILKNILQKHISDTDTLWLLDCIIDSFETPHLAIRLPSVGLPLGNLTSQLLVNIYMNEFDQWIKHSIKEKYYIRYADDFVFFSKDKESLMKLTLQIQIFLSKELHLQLHPDKLYLKTLASAVDFLGWIHFPDHRVLRTSTKRRMFKRLAETRKETVLYSYLGMLKWGNTKKIRSKLLVKMI